MGNCASRQGSTNPRAHAQSSFDAIPWPLDAINPLETPQASSLSPSLHDQMAQLEQLASQGASDDSYFKADTLSQWGRSDGGIVDNTDGAPSLSNVSLLTGGSQSTMPEAPPCEGEVDSLRDFMPDELPSIAVATSLTIQALLASNSSSSSLVDSTIPIMTDDARARLLEWNDIVLSSPLTGTP
jgi:hypothetical protein